MMSSHARADQVPPLSILSYHGPAVTRLLCVEDVKLQLLQAGALTEGEYEDICQPDVMRRKRKAAERVWEALKTKPDGFERLVKALEENVREYSHNSGHDELLNILKGPDFEFEKFKSSVGTHLNEKMCLEVVHLLLKVKVSGGHSLIHPSVLQGCNTWAKLFKQLEQCRLCHALDIDLLSYAFDCVNGYVTNWKPILQCLTSFKTSDYPLQEKVGLTIPLPGFFLMAIHTVDGGLLVTSRLRQLKDALSEALAVTKPHFQYLSTVQGVHYYQFPLRYLDIFPNYLQSGKVDLLSRPGITHIMMRSDSQMMEFNLAAASMDAISSTYTVAYAPIIDRIADSKVPSSRQAISDVSLAVPSIEQPSSAVWQKKAASTSKKPAADSESSEKKDSGHTHSCVANLSPGMHRRLQPVRSSESWSPGPSQRRPSAKRVHTLTLFVVGPKGSGKSTFLQSYMGGHLSTQQQSGVDVKNKVISWNSYSDIKINVWDMPGTQPTQESAKMPVYRDADGFIFVADISNFEDSLVQIKDLRKKANISAALDSRIPMVIVVNKCDGVHGSGLSEVQVHLLMKFIEEHKFTHYFTASAKMDIGVKRVFEYVAARILNSDTEHISIQFHATR